MPTIQLLFFILSTLFTTLQCLESTTILLQPNTTLLSPNKTFELGFFSPNPDTTNIYLSIRYATLPTPIYVWVANRHTPLKDLSSSSLSLSFDRHLILSDSVNFVVWRSPSPGSHIRLLDSGNLVFLSSSNVVVWQSFDYPSDTWLPGMNLTVTGGPLTSWRSPIDPSPGRYSLRLAPPRYGEIELVFNDTVSYWSSGNWSGTAFSNVPEMTVAYIYKFHFDDVFTKTATFGFSEVSTTSDGGPAPFTRFHLGPTGELRQYTWSPQTENWNTFWARPEARCRAYGLCGPNGVCYEDGQRECGCPVGFGPKDGFGWAGGDYSGGCRRKLVGGGGGGSECEEDDKFAEVGVMQFDEAETTSVRGVGSKRECEKGCLGNCSCIGVVYSERSKVCKYLFGVLFNLRNLTSDHNNFSIFGGDDIQFDDDDGILYLRIGKNGLKNKGLSHKMIILVCTLSVLVLISVVMCLVLWVVRKEVRRRRREEEEAILAATHLKVFSYKELHGATRGFSEKLGHGGFGTVFRGTLSDSSLVAVKRLERPGNGGEKEFRAEVCTIGNVQHVNLVRLRGFCSENSHRLLVYDYMHNGPLSGFLKKLDGQNMSWDVRFRVAIGTAKALAYLHEECRQCIVHCDIKPENILLDSDYTAKISDFGLAKLIGRDFSRVLATMRGTWGYVAPEWISGVAITNKADVYSYGMTMLELIGGRRNVEAPPSSPTSGDGGTRLTSDGDNDDADKWYFPPWAAQKIIEGNMAEVVDSRLGVAYNKAEAERLGMVAVWCIQDEEEVRPSMGMVVKILEGVLEVGVPPPPKLLQALVAKESSFGNVDSNVGDFGSDGNNNRVSVDSLSSHSPGNAPSLATSV